MLDVLIIMMGQEYQRRILASNFLRGVRGDHEERAPAPSTPFEGSQRPQCHCDHCDLVAHQAVADSLALTPSVIPKADGAVYIVLDDFGNLGRSYRETDVDDCDRASMVNDLLQGQFHNPVRVIAFNAAEGWSADASEEIARAVLERARAEGETLPRKVQTFCERHTIEYLQADLFAA
jgi:hypothetical protein